MEDAIALGDTTRCPDYGQLVTATLNPFSNLTVLVGENPCADGDRYHAWLEN